MRSYGFEVWTIEQIRAKYIKMFIEAGNGPRQAYRNAKLMAQLMEAGAPPK